MKLIILYLRTFDECNEWLVGQVDDSDDEDGGNELVFDDDPTHK